MRTKIIAEAGVNHNGSVDRAHEMICVAAKCGADIVKFQAWSAELLASRHAGMASYQIANTGESTSQIDLLKNLELPKEAYKELIRTCAENRVEFLCTPMDMPSIELLANLGVGRLKIPSGEITNAPYLVAAGATRIPCIVSTGMATLAEVKAALGAIAWGYFAKKGKPSFQSCSALWDEVQSDGSLREVLTILHCTTEYPAPFSDVNLAAMQSLGDKFQLPVGYSDHTAGISISIAAAALGATIIEKHFTLSRELPGPDHLASLEPKELTELILSVRQVNLAIGNGLKAPANSELGNIPIARKSLVAAQQIPRGELFTASNLVSKRPGSGLSPWKYWDLLGRPAARGYECDDLITEDEAKVD